MGARLKRREYVVRAREFAARGSALPQARLNETLVRRIREEHANAQRLIAEIRERSTAAAIARRYGVHVRTVEKVLNRSSWVHV